MICCDVKCKGGQDIWISDIKEPNISLPAVRCRGPQSFASPLYLCLLGAPAYY